MTAPFAALETRLGQVTRARLADAEAVFAGVDDAVPGIFENTVVRAAVGNNGAIARAPVFTCDTTLLPVAAVEGGTFLVGAVGYRIANRQDDAALGESVLELERTS